MTFRTSSIVLWLALATLAGCSAGHSADPGTSDRSAAEATSVPGSASADPSASSKQPFDDPAYKPVHTKGQGNCLVQPPASWQQKQASLIAGSLEVRGVDSESEHALVASSGTDASVSWFDNRSRRAVRKLVDLGDDDTIMTSGFSKDLVVFATSVGGYGLNAHWALYAWDRKGEPRQIAASEEGDEGFPHPTPWPKVTVHGESVYWVQTLKSDESKGARLMRWTPNSKDPSALVDNVMEGIHHAGGRVIVRKAGQDEADPQGVVVLNAATGDVVDDPEWSFLNSAIEVVSVGDTIYLVRPAGNETYELWEVKNKRQYRLLYSSDEGTHFGDLVATDRWIVFIGDTNYNVIDRKSGSHATVPFDGFLAGGGWVASVDEDSRRTSVYPESALEGLPACK